MISALGYDYICFFTCGKNNFCSLFEIIKCLRLLFTVKISKGTLFWQRPIQNIAKQPRTSIFVKIVNGWNSLTIFAKHSILDVWQGSEYACVSK